MTLNQKEAAKRRWESSEYREKQISSHLGNPNPNKGKHMWANKAHPRGNLGKKKTPDELIRMSERSKGKNNAMYGVRLEQNVERMKNNNPMKNPEISKRVHTKLGILAKERCKNPEFKENWMKKLRAGMKRPTLPERILTGIVEKNNLPFNYVGKGEIWFQGETQMFNPDFLSKNPKHIIEVYGDYWHNIPEQIKIDEERLKTYSKYGYRTLIIWEKELKQGSEEQIVQKIKNFVEAI